MQRSLDNTETPAGAAAFRSTHWTEVMDAAQQESVAGQTALSNLYRTYWSPIYAFIRRSGHSAEEAADLTQDFFARLLEKNWLISVTREGGKFRSLLLTAVKHFLANARDHARAQKRGGGTVPLSLDAEAPETRYLLEPVDLLTPERVFERRWALSVLETVLARLRTEYRRAEKADLFEELKVFLSGTTRPISHAEIAGKYNITVSAVGVAVHRLRRRYGELLRDEIARTVTNPREIDDEIRHLIAVLGQQGHG
jgi:RNA polymerase sigma factor (sigma-70 family)